MGLFTNIGRKVSGALTNIGSKVGNAVVSVGTKVSKYAGIGADIAGKLALGAAFFQPEFAPVLAGAAATLRGIKGGADIATAGGRAFQGGDVRGAIDAGRNAFDAGRNAVADGITVNRNIRAMQGGARRN